MKLGPFKNLVEFRHHSGEIKLNPFSGATCACRKTLLSLPVYPKGARSRLQSHFWEPSKAGPKSPQLIHAELVSETILSAPYRYRIRSTWCWVMNSDRDSR